MKLCVSPTLRSNAFQCVRTSETLPTTFDDFQSDVRVNGCPVKLRLWDNSNQQGYDRLCPLAYQNNGMDTYLKRTLNKDIGKLNDLQIWN